MQKAMDETTRRRNVQLAFNQANGITPQTIVKAIRTGIEAEIKARHTVASAIRAEENDVDQTEIIKLLEEEMLEAARNLEFERAAKLRDKINEMKGAPMIKSGSTFTPEGEEQKKIWQPKTSTRHGKRVAK
jgi:excinuclease ABC subunit B